MLLQILICNAITCVNPNYLRMFLVNKPPISINQKIDVTTESVSRIMILHTIR